MKILEEKDNEVKRVLEAKNKEICEIKKVYEQALRNNKQVDKEITRPNEKKIENLENRIHHIKSEQLFEKASGNEPEIMNFKGPKIAELEGYQSQFMCFFINNTKRLCVIDIISGNDTKAAINIPDNLSMNTGFCELPNEKWFYYSNVAGNCSGVCYIFDIKSKTGVKQKTFKPKRYIGSCCYVNNCVYSFGGNMNGGPCCDSEKFDLKTLNWQEIPPIPSPCTYISTVSNKNKILISAYQYLGIMEYNTSNQSYMSYLDLKLSTYHTILTSGYDSIYLFQNNSLWDITNYNQNQLTMINSQTGVPNFKLISGPIRNGWKIYFILDNKQLWRFDLRSKEILSMRQLD